MPTYVVMVRKKTNDKKKFESRKIKLWQPSAWDAEQEARRQLVKGEEIIDISMFNHNESEVSPKKRGRIPIAY